MTPIIFLSLSTLLKRWYSIFIVL